MKFRPSSAYFISDFFSRKRYPLCHSFEINLSLTFWGSRLKNNVKTQPGWLILISWGQFFKLGIRYSLAEQYLMDTLLQTGAQRK